MNIILMSGYMSPTFKGYSKMNPKERAVFDETRIENKLKKLGFTVNVNAAKYECSTCKQLLEMMLILEELGITHGQVCWA